MLIVFQTDHFIRQFETIILKQHLKRTDEGEIIVESRRFWSISKFKTSFACGYTFFFVILSANSK